MRDILKSPYDLVAKVLELSPEDLNENSAMGETPNWDSLNHIDIIGEIEKHYAIKIPDQEIEKYVTMKAIIDVYKRKSGGLSLRERIIERVKNNFIGRIFFK